MYSTPTTTTTATSTVTLPENFDYLHPCCQKDLLENQYTTRLLTTLRANDRSNTLIHQRRLLTAQLVSKSPHQQMKDNHLIRSIYQQNNNSNCCNTQNCHIFVENGSNVGTLLPCDYPALHTVRLAELHRQKDEHVAENLTIIDTKTTEKSGKYRSSTCTESDLENDPDSDDSDDDYIDETVLELERLHRLKLVSQMNEIQGPVQPNPPSFIMDRDNNIQQQQKQQIQVSALSSSSSIDKDINITHSNSNASTEIGIKDNINDKSLEDCCAPALAYLLDLLAEKDSIALSQYGYLVVHFYDPNSMDCGYLDLILEELVLLYPGTCFLRCNLHEANAKLLNIAFPETTDRLSSLYDWKNSKSNNTRSDDVTSSFDSRYHYPALIPFYQGERKNTFRLKDFFTPCLNSFLGDEYTVNERKDALYSAVVKVLTNCHILETELPLHLPSSSSNSFFIINKKNSKNNQEEEEEEEEYYDCGMPGCHKPFFHQHVNTEKQMLPEFNGLLN